MPTSSFTGIGERRTRALSAGAKPASERIAGWIPREISRTFVEQVPQSLGELGQLRLHVVIGGGNGLLCHAESQAQRDQLLLDTVVQVALDLSSRVVRGCEDPPPRRGERRDSDQLEA